MAQPLQYSSRRKNNSICEGEKMNDLLNKNLLGVMKRTVASVFTIFLAIFALISTADAMVWWPEVAPVSSQLTVYQDYQNKKLFYYIPSGVRVSTNADSGSRMISHGLFFNRLKPENSTTLYNLTMEPILESKALEDAQRNLAARYGSDAQLVPLPITTASFEMTQKFGDAEKANQISSPFLVDVPSWTGDMHSFHQRFSVVMKGNAYIAEPAMSRFMTNPAANAFVGTMHYGFRGVQIPFKGYMKVNIHQFVSKLRTHLSVSAAWSSIDIKTAIEKLKDDQSVFVDVMRDEGYESQVWNSLVAKMMNLIFEPAPKAPEVMAGGGGGKRLGFLSFKASFSLEYASSTVDKVYVIDLKEQVVKDHSGDIDLHAGGIEAKLLDTNIRYLCDMWAKFDRAQDKCVEVCEPGIEYYNPKTKTCQPAFGAADL